MLTYTNYNQAYWINTMAQSQFWQGTMPDSDLMFTVNYLRNEILNTNWFQEKMDYWNLINEGMIANNSTSIQNYDEKYLIDSNDYIQINWYEKIRNNDICSKFSPKLALTENNQVWSKGQKESQGDNSECEKLWSYTNSFISELQTNECKSNKSKDQDECESEHKTFWAWGLSQNESIVWDKILTPNNIQYLEALKEFDYAIEERRKTAKSKMSFVFIWKHKDGWEKEFQRWWNLLDHCRTHKGIRPFKCDVWGKQFTQKGNLNKHLQIHS